MINGLRVSVIIPTLNEAKGIRQTLELIPKFVDEVIVVDGDSQDNTREIAQSMGAKVINEKRKGYGRAFLTGFENATSDIIATADGDGTYPIEDLQPICEHLLYKNMQFVSCSRFPIMDRSSMRARNHFGNKVITQIASALWSYPFKDVLSGMWVFRKEILERINLYSDSWNLSEEIKIQALIWNKRDFCEYHISYRERLGETKLVPWKVGIENIIYLFAMKLRLVPQLQWMKRKLKRGLEFVF